MDDYDPLRARPSRGDAQLFGIGLKFALMGLALLGIIGVLIFGAVGGFRYITAPFRGAVEVERQIESGASRIALYNLFHDRCASIQGLEGTIDSQRNLLAALDPDGDDYSRTLINIAGLEGRRLSEINRYNEDAAKDYTAARFLDADLPYALSVAAYSGDNRTRCSAN